MTEKNMSIEEKRLQKIAQLKARLQKEEAMLKKSQRKERDGQLVVFGVLVEELYKTATKDERMRWAEKANQLLTDRNLARALAGFERLDIAFPK